MSMQPTDQIHIKERKKTPNQQQQIEKIKLTQNYVEFTNTLNEREKNTESIEIVVFGSCAISLIIHFSYHHQVYFMDVLAIHKL